VRNPWKVVLGVVLSVFLLAACAGGDEGGDEPDGGGGQSVSAASYATTLCTSIQGYVDEVTTLSTDFAAGIDPGASLEEQKQGVLGFLDQVLVATGGLIDELAAAGVPDVDGGEAVAAAIEASLEEARTVLEDARAQVEAIPVDDPQAFAEQLDAIGTTIQTSLGEIGGSLEGIESEELTAAVQEEPACSAFAP
jgi:hypothetical protein